MKCKCGGDLKRIAVDCYECEICKLKQMVAFLQLPKPEIKQDNIININCDSHSVTNDIIESIAKEIYKCLGVNKGC